MNNVIVVDREVISNIIDCLEDWMESKGLTKDNFPNKEREENDDFDNEALIYGKDFDKLEESIRETLRTAGIIAPNNFDHLDTIDIENNINR